VDRAAEVEAEWAEAEWAEAEWVVGDTEHPRPSRQLLLKRDAMSDICMGYHLLAFHYADTDLSDSIGFLAGVSKDVSLRGLCDNVRQFVNVN